MRGRLRREAASIVPPAIHSEEVGGRVLVADDVTLPAGLAPAAPSAGGGGDAEAVLVADVSPHTEASGHALCRTRFGCLLAAHGGTGTAAASELLVALALVTLTAHGCTLVSGHARAVPRGTDQAWLAVALGSADALAETPLSGSGSSGTTARHQVTFGAGGFAVGIALGVPDLSPRVT